MNSVLNSVINNNNVFIDCDDTIFNTLDEWTKELNKISGCNFTSADMTQWELLKTYTMLTKNEISAPLFNPDFWKNVSPKEDAVKYITQLYSDGFEVYLTTATHFGIINSKMINMVNKYLPFIDYKHLIIAYNKGLLHGRCLIDDHPDNFTGGLYKKILFNAPHNQGCVAKDIIRVHNWKECYEEIIK